jgi:hypothetical protein
MPVIPEASIEESQLVVQHSGDHEKPKHLGCEKELIPA